MYTACKALLIQKAVVFLSECTRSLLCQQAGSRVGWAIVGDESIAQLMRDHVARASGYVQENQLRATHLLQYVKNNHGVHYCSVATPSSLADKVL